LIHRNLYTACKTRSCYAVHCNDGADAFGGNGGGFLFYLYYVRGMRFEMHLIEENIPSFLRHQLALANSEQENRVKVLHDGCAGAVFGDADAFQQGGAIIKTEQQLPLLAITCRPTHQQFIIVCFYYYAAFLIKCFQIYL